MDSFQSDCFRTLIAIPRIEYEICPKHILRILIYLNFINEFEAITFYCPLRHCSHIHLLRPTYNMWMIYDWILDSNIKPLQLAKSKWMKFEMVKRNIIYFLHYVNKNVILYSLAYIRYRTMTCSFNRCYQEYGVPKCLRSIKLYFWKILLMILSHLWVFTLTLNPKWKARLTALMYFLLMQRYFAQSMVS